MGTTASRSQRSGRRQRRQPHRREPPHVAGHRLRARLRQRAGHARHPARVAPHSRHRRRPGDRHLARSLVAARFLPDAGDGAGGNFGAAPLRLAARPAGAGRRRPHHHQARRAGGHLAGGAARRSCRARARWREAADRRARLPRGRLDDPGRIAAPLRRLGDPARRESRQRARTTVRSVPATPGAGGRGQGSGGVSAQGRNAGPEGRAARAVARGGGGDVGERRCGCHRQSRGRRPRHERNRGQERGQEGRGTLRAIPPREIQRRQERKGRRRRAEDARGLVAEPLRLRSERRRADRPRSAELGVGDGGAKLQRSGAPGAGAASLPGAALVEPAAVSRAGGAAGGAGVFDPAAAAAARRRMAEGAAAARRGRGAGGAAGVRRAGARGGAGAALARAARRAEEPPAGGARLRAQLRRDWANGAGGDARRAAAGPRGVGRRAGGDPVPGGGNDWSPTVVRVDGKAATSLGRSDGILWLALPAGTFRVERAARCPRATASRLRCRCSRGS